MVIFLGFRGIMVIGEKKKRNHQMWQKYAHIWSWYCPLWQWNRRMWEKNKGTSKCGKSIVKNDIGTA